MCVYIYIYTCIHAYVQGRRPPPTAARRGLRGGLGAAREADITISYIIQLCYILYDYTSTYKPMYMYMYMYIYLSISLSLYICIYTHST